MQYCVLKLALLLLSIIQLSVQRLAILECPELPSLKNGNIAENEMLDDECDEVTIMEAEYTCDDGFELEGPVIRTCIDCSDISSNCTKDITNYKCGVWNMTAPFCKPVCEPLEKIPKEKIQYSQPPTRLGNYNVGTVATFLDDVGRKSTRECVGPLHWSSGTENPSPPTYQKIVIGFEKNFSVSEDVGTFEVCFRVFDLPDHKPFSLSVDLVASTAVGSAGERDYAPIYLATTFNNTVCRACFNVTIFADYVYENKEEFSLLLAFNKRFRATKRAPFIIYPAMATVSIEDINSVTIGFINLPYVTSEANGVVHFEVGVIGSTVLDREVVVEFSTRDLYYTSIRNAFPGHDYIPISNQAVRLDSLVMRQFVNVTLINDQVFELTERLLGSLSPTGLPPRVSLNPSIAIATINDDDGLSFGYDTASVSVDEEAGSFYATISLHGDPGWFVLIIDYETFDFGSGVGFAQAGEDYIADSGSLTLMSGDSGGSHKVVILADELPEEPESFGLRLVGFSLEFGEPIPYSEEFTRISIVPPNSTVKILDNGPWIGDISDKIPCLVTVPLNVNKSGIINVPGNNVGPDDIINLCYKLNCVEDSYFNLVSDTCVSVNAHYDLIAPDDEWMDANVMDSVYIKAIDKRDNCQKIEVTVDETGSCSASVSPSRGGLNAVEVNREYRSNGVSVRVYPNRVRVGVPNCNSQELVMWVFCSINSFPNGTDTKNPFSAPTMKFVIVRGLNNHVTSHGIMGQFWNVPTRVNLYTGRNVNKNLNLYEITVDRPYSRPHTFLGSLYSLTNKVYCLYAGGLYTDIIDGLAVEGVLEGLSADYIMTNSSSTDFLYSRFDGEKC